MNLASGRLRPAELAAVLALHAGAIWAVGHQASAALPEPVAPPVLVASLIAAPVSAAAPAAAPTPVERKPEVVKRTPAPLPAPRPSPVLAVQSPAPAQMAAPAPVEAAPPSPPVAAATPAPAAPPAPAAMASAAPAQPRTVSSGISYLRPPAPEYPGLSRRRGEAGVVELRVLVDAGGIPQRAEVTRSSGHERLDNAAIAAAMKALFKPHVVDGAAVPIWALIATRFDLDS
ncbi:energy transducer TonB [Derxia lacustris]|uniref:energy transducer TonB n=1 Tax=Derxia lacustris TaxID=764842 RepID=UPI000A16D772|nr:energy transducer TonB [Derxia lacustris]